MIDYINAAGIPSPVAVYTNVNSMMRTIFLVLGAAVPPIVVIVGTQIRENRAAIPADLPK